jgi:diguanylate cyclase (GGDEF)-like protein
MPARDRRRSSEQDVRKTTDEQNIIMVTMSIGVTCLEPGMDTVDSFVKRADDAMYRSKQGAKDRISMAE